MQSGTVVRAKANKTLSKRRRLASRESDLRRTHDLETTSWGDGKPSLQQLDQAFARVPEQLKTLEPVEDPIALDKQLQDAKEKALQQRKANKAKKNRPRSAITTVSGAIDAAHTNALSLEISAKDAHPFQTENLVFTALLNVQLDLPRVAAEFGGLYDPDVFPAAICRFATPLGTASIFSPGKIVLTGIKHPYHAMFKLMLIAFNLYRHFGLIVNAQNLCIRNCIASASLGYKLDLVRFYRDHQDCCRYEPSSFPGLHFPTTRSDIQQKYHNLTFGIFSSGNIVTTGGTDTRIAKKAFDTLEALLTQYKLEP